jgi:hypothetical protein
MTKARREDSDILEHLLATIAKARSLAQRHTFNEPRRLIDNQCCESASLSTSSAMISNERPL